jgi:hypothetical protein
MPPKVGKTDEGGLLINLVQGCSTSRIRNKSIHPRLMTAQSRF